MRTPLFSAAMTTLVVIAFAACGCSEKSESTEEAKAEVSFTEDSFQNHHDSVSSLHYGNPLLY